MTRQARAAVTLERCIVGPDGQEIIAEIRLADTKARPTIKPEKVLDDATVLTSLSYSEQYDLLKRGGRMDTKQPVPKPNRAAQQRQPGARRIFLSDVYGVPKRAALWGRRYVPHDITFAIFFCSMHLLALAAPWTASWRMFGLFLVSWFVSGCLGITLSYHRQLSHRSFETPKWLEYTLAYCGVLAVQMSPIEWVSKHRYHHLHTDTPLDPHSTYEGFWWAHVGWMMDRSATEERVHDRSNAGDLSRQPYYRWLQSTYRYHVLGQLAALYAFGGFPALVWGGGLRLTWLYHITFGINSFSHLWGYQTYDTGDLSRNLWWMGILAWGEGHHNNHHAFGYSARHGLEWHQVDVTWMIIRALQALGLATKVRLPSEKAKARMALPSQSKSDAAAAAQAPVPTRSKRIAGGKAA